MLRERMDHLVLLVDQVTKDRLGLKDHQGPQDLQVHLETQELEVMPVLLVHQDLPDNQVTEAFPEHLEQLEIKDSLETLDQLEIKVLVGSQVKRDLLEMLDHQDNLVFKDYRDQLVLKVYQVILDREDSLEMQEGWVHQANKDRLVPLAFLETLAQLDLKDNVVLQDQLELLGLLGALDLQDFLVNVVPQALMDQLGLVVCLDYLE